MGVLGGIMGVFGASLASWVVMKGIWGVLGGVVGASGESWVVVGGPGGHYMGPGWHHQSFWGIGVVFGAYGGPGGAWECSGAVVRLLKGTTVVLGRLMVVMGVLGASQGS